MRFSILTLLGLVAFAAVACAALRNPTDLWQSCFHSLVIGSLLAALVPAVLLGGRTRAFWTGFVIIGWGFVLQDTSPFDNGKRLLSDVFLDHLADRFAPDSDSLVLQKGDNAYFEISGEDVSFTEYNPVHFEYVAIGESILTFALALMGGCLGVYCYSLRQKQNAQAAGIASHSPDEKTGV